MRTRLLSFHLAATLAAIAPQMMVLPLLAIASVAIAQQGLSADPLERWKSWQNAGDATVKTPQLRDGNVYRLTPAEIIYYSGVENRVNPVLLLVKLQHEQGLLATPSSDAVALQKRLDRAAGFGILDSDPNHTNWAGFYPQLVAASYQFGDLWKKTYPSSAQAIARYSSDPAAGQKVAAIYQDYAGKMNRIAGKRYSTAPTGWGHVDDFQDIGPAQIQSFLDLFPGNLKNRGLFGGAPVSNGAKAVNQPAIPGQIVKDQRLSFVVQTDKPAEQVKITFQNPMGEVALNGSGTQWTFDRPISAAGNRSWVISVMSGGKVSDDHLRGTLDVRGKLEESSSVGKIVGVIEAPARLSVNDEMKVRLQTSIGTQKVIIDFGSNTSFDLSADAAHTTWTWSKPVTQPGRREYTVKVFAQGQSQPSDQRTGSVQIDGNASALLVHPLPGHNLARIFADPEYPKVFGVEHTGVDWMAPIGTPVKAICDGAVTGNRTIRPDVVNAVLSIQHNCGGNQVYAYYGHIASPLVVGSKIKSGDTVGTVRQYGSNNHHLHFGIKKDLITVGWGRAPKGTSRQAMLNAGWIDPEEFLRGTSGFTQTKFNPFEIAPQERVSREQFGLSLLDAVAKVGQSYIGAPEQRIRSAGLIQGDFRGNEPIIRGDAIRMAYRLLAKHADLGRLIGTKPVDRFNLDADLEDDAELRQQANVLAALGIVYGAQNGTIFELEPGRQLSRNEQASVIDHVRNMLSSVVGQLVGPKIVNNPSIPATIVQNGRLAFSVSTDKPAERVVMVFKNPDGEAPFVGSGTNFSFDKQITAAGTRPWKLRVYANNNQVVDEHLSGTLTVRPVDLPAATVMVAVQAQGTLMMNTPATLAFTGNNLNANVRVTLADCENGQTQLVSPTQLIHKCVPRKAGQVMAGWKADASVPNPINVGTVNVQDPAAAVTSSGPLAAKVDAFVSTWMGKPVDVDKSYGYQCVDLMHQYAKDVLGRDGEFSRGNAYSVFVNTNSPNMRKVTNTPNAVPAKGDVIFWKPAPSNGNVGHVGIFVTGDAKQFTSFDQNFCANTGAGTGNCAPRLVAHTYDGVAGWISTSSQTVPILVPPTNASVSSVQTQGSATVNAVATFIFQGQNLTPDVRVTVSGCDQPQTQLLNATQIRHQCIPRLAGQQPAGWKANGNEVNVRPLGSVNIATSVMQPPVPTPAPVPVPAPQPVIASIQPQGQPMLNQPAAFIFQGQNLTTDVRVTVFGCDQPQTQLLNSTQIRHQCIPRQAGQQPAGWKANGNEVNVRPLGSVNIAAAPVAQPPVPTPAPVPMPAPQPVITGLQPQGQPMLNQPAAFIFQGQNLTPDVRVTVFGCDQPQTQLLNATQIRHQCIPRQAGQQPAGWKTNGNEVNVRPLGSVNIAAALVAQPPVQAPTPTPLPSLGEVPPAAGCAPGGAKMCGVDGRTYPNACTLVKSGVAKRGNGPC